MKLGIFDFGTRAARLIVGETDDLLSQGFDFRLFRNWGDLTEMGDGLIQNQDGEYEYRLTHLAKTVAFIDYHLDVAEQYGVKRKDIYALGTEVFRKPVNWQQVIDMIQSVTGLRITILSPMEEAQTSFYAVAVAFMRELKGTEPFVVVEQGGGSMQVTMAEIDENGRISTKGQTSIPELGTLLLRRKFIDFSDEGKRVGTVTKDVFDFATSRINAVLKDEFDRLNFKKPTVAYGLGRGITDFYPGSNKKVHGREIRGEQLAQNEESFFLQTYRNYAIKSLIKDAGEHHIHDETIDSIHLKLEEYYSRPCYAAVLNFFGLNKIKVCGTGLRYGAFFRITYKQWNTIDEFKG